MPCGLWRANHASPRRERPIFTPVDAPVAKFAHFSLKMRRSLTTWSLNKYEMFCESLNMDIFGNQGAVRISRPMARRWMDTAQRERLQFTRPQCSQWLSSLGLGFAALGLAIGERRQSRQPPRPQHDHSTLLSASRGGDSGLQSQWMVDGKSRSH